MATYRASSGINEPVGCSDTVREARILPYLTQLTATAVFFLICAVSSPVSWLVHKTAGDRIPARTGQKLLRCLFRFYTWWMKITGVLRIEISGLEAFREARGTIFVSNHPALLDAFFLMAALPPAACVMRADLLRNPLMCGNALLGGYVTNDSGPAFVRQGIEKLRSGGNLLIFPEGTRTVAPFVNRFKNGFAMVAAHAGAPVQAVVIEYHGSHLTKGVSLFAPASLPLQFRIRAGQSFRAEPGESAAGFSRRIESWFIAELQNQFSGS